MQDRVEKKFRTTLSMLVPLITIAVLSLILVIGNIISKGTSVNSILAIVAVLPLYVLLLNWFVRCVSVDEDGLTFRSLFKTVNINWLQIKSIMGICSLGKITIVLGLEKKYLIISNLFRDFNSLTKLIVERSKSAEIKEDLEGLLNRPTFRRFDVILLWIGVVIFILLIYLKLYR